VNTKLAKHRDDGAPFTHRNKILDDQARDSLRFQYRSLPKKETVKSNESKHFVFERAREQQGAVAINQESKRHSSCAGAIKIVSLNQSTTHCTVVLQTGYRQVDKSFFLPSDRPYPFSLGKMLTCNRHEEQMKASIDTKTQFFLTTVCEARSGAQTIFFVLRQHN
jgi:hypothetical protein